MLEAIPIYRMVLKPESYLLQAQPVGQVIDMICELPNTDNEHRRRALSLLPREDHEKYYNARLLVETKRFIREMLYNCEINSVSYSPQLQGQDLYRLFDIISQLRVPFFRYLVLKDLNGYKLLKGYMQNEIEASKDVGEIQMHIRKDGSMRSTTEADLLLIRIDFRCPPKKLT
jgi:hypothetical protein